MTSPSGMVNQIGITFAIELNYRRWPNGPRVGPLQFQAGCCFRLGLLRALVPLVEAVLESVFRAFLSNGSCRLFSSGDPACRTPWTVPLRARILSPVDEIPAGVVSMADRAGTVHVE